MEDYTPFTIYIYAPMFTAASADPLPETTQVGRYMLLIDLEKVSDVLNALQNAEYKRLAMRETPSAYLIGPKSYLTLINAKQKWPTINHFLTLYSPVNNLEMFWKGVPIYCIEHLHTNTVITTIAPGGDMNKHFVANERARLNDNSPF